MLAAVLAGGAHGATYIVTNNQGTDSSAVVDNTGVRLSSTTGSAVFGVFSTPPGDTAVTSATSAASLLSTFTQFGSNQATFTDFSLSPPPAQYTGLFTLQATVSDGGLNPTFQNKNIYLIVGNATTLAAASQFLVIKFTATFGDLVSPSSSTLTLDTANTDYTVLRGSKTGPSVTVGGSDSTTEPSFQLSLIPEPSSAMLAAVGALVLLRRRRS